MRDEGAAVIVKSGAGVEETVMVFDAVTPWLRASVAFRTAV